MRTAKLARQPEAVDCEHFLLSGTKNFRSLWFGTLFMSGGQWIQQVTLGWLLYDLINARLATGAF